jgi:hypothetical protein
MHERKLRSDAGHPLPMPRDQLTLTWIAEQYTATFKQVQRLLVLYSEEQAPGKLLLSDTATRNALTRWQILGFIEEPQRLWYQYTSFIWLARGGLSDLGLPYRYYVPKRGQVHHHVSVNEVSLSIQGAQSPDIWIPRRTLVASSELRQKGPATGEEVPKERTFFPDALLSLEGVEDHVALSIIEQPKPRQDVLLLTEGLLKHYRALRYYVCREMLSLVQDIRAQFSHCPLFDIYDLTTMQPVARQPAHKSVSIASLAPLPDAASQARSGACTPGRVRTARRMDPAAQGKGKIKGQPVVRLSSEHTD